MRVFKVKFSNRASDGFELVLVYRNAKRARSPECRRLALHAQNTSIGLRPARPTRLPLRVVRPVAVPYSADQHGRRGSTTPRLRSPVERRRRRRPGQMAGPLALARCRGCRQPCSRAPPHWPMRPRRSSPTRPTWITPESAASRHARLTRTATSETCRSRWRCPRWTPRRSTPGRNTPASCVSRGVIEGTVLTVQGCWRVLGTPGSTVSALEESADRTDRVSVSDVAP